MAAGWSPPTATAVRTPRGTSTAAVVSAEARPRSCPRATSRRRGRADGPRGRRRRRRRRGRDARPPRPQPRRARAEDYDEFVAFTGVDRATAERFVDGALGRGLSLRDAIRAFFEGQGRLAAAAAALESRSARTVAARTFSAGDLGGAVTEASAVGELRALVAKHYDSEPKRIRPVSRGEYFADDARRRWAPRASARRTSSWSSS